MSRRRVAVTGLGLVCPFGSDADALFAALMRGESAVREETVGEGDHTLTIHSAACRDFDAAAALGRSRAAVMDRCSQLAAAAASSAWHDAGLAATGALTAEVQESGCVLWGTGAGGTQTLERCYRELFLRDRTRISPLSVVQGMNNAAASHLAMMFGLGGACLTYSVACASSAVAVGEGLRRIRSGDCQVVLVGGSEAALPYALVKAWESLQVLATSPDGDASHACRPFDNTRSGLVLGEGAAALVLEDWDHACARGARIHAELAGYGSSCDHAHLTMPQAEGQLRALRAALRDARADPGDIGYVNAHGTATSEGDPVEISAMRSLLGGHAANVAISSTKSMHGHLMGASGAIEALITVKAVQSGAVPPTANLAQVDPACAGLDHVRGTGRTGVRLHLALSNSFAFGGSNAVLAFRRAA